MGSRLEQVSSYLLKNLYWRSSFSVPSTPTRVSLGTREERSLLDSGGSSRSSETGSWTVSKGKVRVLMSYLRPFYKQLSKNFKKEMNSEVGSTGALLQVEPAPGPEIQICRGGGAGRVFHPICLDPGYPSISSWFSNLFFVKNARILAIDFHHFSGCIGVGIAWDYFLPEEALW